MSPVEFYRGFLKLHTRAQLEAFAKRLGLSRTGTKQQLVDRCVAHQVSVFPGKL